MIDQRLFDLVRHQRNELHEAGLITDEEYVELIDSGDVGGSVKRLEGYDAMKRRLTDVQALSDDQDELLSIASYCRNERPGLCAECRRLIDELHTRAVEQYRKR